MKKYGVKFGNFFSRLIDLADYSSLAKYLFSPYKLFFLSRPSFFSFSFSCSLINY